MKRRPARPYVVLRRETPLCVKHKKIYNQAMQDFEYFLFDFDGTIFDTSEGIFNSLDKVCVHYNLENTRDDFSRMIGPPLSESFATVFHLPESEIQDAIKVYRDYYSKEGMFQCSLYPGVTEMIQRLKSKGRKVFIATSKPEIYTKQILERKGLLQFFDFVGGADFEEKVRCEKVDVINYVLSVNRLSGQKEKCLMLGDRNYDINGAHKAGLKAAGVLWGFGGRKELEEAGADFIFETPEEIQGAFCK